MRYLITSIKEIEDIITPSLVIDDLFDPFPFPKQEEYFRSCMRLYRIETFGEDYEKSPISFEEFNPRYDKFYGLNYNRLTEIIEIEEFKINLKQLFNRHEDYFIEDITEQLPNSSEAEFKLFLYNSLKTLKDSYDFLISTDINNNVILKLVKNELIESYQRAFEKAKITFPIYDDILKLNVMGIKNLYVDDATTENDFYNNPYPRIFSDIESFLFCEELIKNICNVKRTRLADCSFVFRMMQKDGYIYDDVSEVSFRNFLTINYEFTFDKLKTYEYCYTDKKFQLYNSLKK